MVKQRRVCLIVLIGNYNYRIFARTVILACTRFLFFSFIGSVVQPITICEEFLLIWESVDVKWSRSISRPIIDQLIKKQIFSIHSLVRFCRNGRCCSSRSYLVLACEVWLFLPAEVCRPNRNSYCRPDLDEGS